METTTAKKSVHLWQSWIIFAVASIFFLYEFVIQISPNVMSSELMQSFHVDATGLGIISGTYYITYTLMQIPVGVLYDRFGPRKLLSLACFSCALGAVLFGITDSIYAASLGRMLMGFGSAFAFTGCLFLVHRWFHPRYFALMAGLVMVMSSLGSILGETPLARAIEDYGWRDTINYIGVAGFFLTVIVYLIIRDKPRHSLSQNDDSKESTELKSFGDLLKEKQNWTVAIYAFTSWAPILILPAFIGVLFVETAYGVSKTQASNAMIIAWLGIGVGSTLLGWLSDKINRRVILLSLSSLVGLVSISLAIYYPALGYKWLCVWLFLFGFSAGAQSLTFAVIKDNNPKSQVGAAMGFNNVLVVCGGAIFQPLVGYLLSLFWDGTLDGTAPVYQIQAFQYALMVVPGCFLIGLLFALVGIRETYCRSYEERNA